MFLYVAVRALDWRALFDTLRHAHPGYTGLGLASLLAYFVVKALRWRFLVSPFARPTALQLLPSVLAGLAGNYVFPHAGEIPRAVLAAKLLNAPASALLASVAIERIFDFLVILVIVLAVLLPVGHMSTESRRPAISSAHCARES